MLGQDEDFTVVGEASDVLSAKVGCAKTLPDMVVLDLSMPDVNGVEVVDIVHRAAPAARILVLSMHEDATTVRDALLAGASGYVVKRASHDDILMAAKALARGFSVIHISLPAKEQPLHELIRGTPEPVARFELTEREMAVLQLIASGCTNREIAGRLFISIKSVEAHRTKLSIKTGMRRRSELVRLAMNLGVTQGNP